MTDYRPSYEQFLKDVSKHEMSIKQDTGVYRHIRYSDPRTGEAAFQITTFPGALVYSGDMGTYVFERIEDMFQFFRRGATDDQRYRINPQYWAEKVQAVDRHGSIETFSDDKFRAAIVDAVDSFLESHPEFSREVLMDEIREQIPDHCSNLQEALDEINRFVFREADETDPTGTYVTKRGRQLEVFPDFYERSLEVYSYRFIWCCYAIVWAIEKYDEAKTYEQDCKSTVKFVA